MYRQIISTYSKTVSSDVLLMQQYALEEAGSLWEANFSANGIVWGLTATPTSPATLYINLGRGGITSLQQVDASGYGSLPANSNSIVKHGSWAATQQIGPFSAPGTSGYSINYLVEACFNESDTNPVTLSYVNASNGVTYTGATAVNTTRAATCSIQIKAGTAAATGTQTTPATDSGWTALYVVTVNYGQTQIVANNIATVTTAPWASKLYIPYASPVLLGPPSNADNSNSIATTSFVWDNFASLSNVSTSSTPSTIAKRDGSGGLTATQFNGIATSAINANSATWSSTANSASFATWAQVSNTSTYATSAGTAASANIATLATSALTANTAATATNANQLGGYGASVASSPSTVAVRDSGSNLYCNILFGVATSADFADTAERYASDYPYAPGTLVQIGGEAEITIATQATGAWSVISTAPAFLMRQNVGTNETHPPVVLTGRVPVRVTGKIGRGDWLIASAIDGVAEGSSRPFAARRAVGRALEAKDSDGEGLVEAFVQARL